MAFYVSEIKNDIPEKFGNDISREIYTALSTNKIRYTRVESDPGITMDDCLNIDRAFGVDTVKTILLTNRQKNKFWLYVTHARAPFVTKDFCASLSIPRVSFADESLMMQLIGCQHGAATAFALIRDTQHNIEFIMDEDVAARQAIVITDGTPCGFICINLSDLFKLLDRKPTIICRNTSETPT